MEILPFLFLGSALHASKKDMLDGMGISALLNVSSNCPNHFEGIYQYKCIPVEDNHKEDISSWFIEAIEFIGMFNHLNNSIIKYKKDKKKSSDSNVLLFRHSLFRIESSE